MAKKSLKNKISYRCYRIIRWFVWLFYPKIEIVGTGNLPDAPCLIVGNHAQMHGPIIGELYVPGKRAIWCAGEMMHLKEIPAYAYQDFWSSKPKCTCWFYKLLSFLIAPLAVCIFNQAYTIPVYKDSRILTTFRQTVTALAEGANVVVFPECAEPCNHIINQFQDGFTDIARLYQRRCGKPLHFVPMYIAPELKKAYLGAPITYRPDAPKDVERQRICDNLIHAITEMAINLPPHTVIPYNNIPKKDYPTNVPCEKGAEYEATYC